MKKNSMLTTLISTFIVTLLSSVNVAFAQTDATPGAMNLTSVGFKKSKFDTSIGEIALFEAGEGKPILLLHGVGAGASSFLWFKLAPALAKKYRVIAPDFVGWGESERPARDLLFNDYVQQIKEIGEWIGEPVHIVSQSLSTGFAIKGIENGEITVDKIALFTPSGGFDFGVDAFGEQATESFVRISESPQRIEYYKQFFHQKPAVEDWWRKEGFLNGNNVPEEIIEANFYNAKQPNAAYSALPFLSGTLRYDIAPLLEDLKVPAIMLWGEKEFRINPSVQKQIGAVNPAIHVVQIKNARSAFDIEQPEQTLDVLENFFKE